MKNKSTSKGGYVYLFRDGNGLYKIGRTTDVSRRLSAFCGMPTKVICVHFFYASNSLWMESALHGRFAEQRLNGEWFRLEESDVASIQSLADNPAIEDIDPDFNFVRCGGRRNSKPQREGRPQKEKRPPATVDQLKQVILNHHPRARL